MSDNIIKFRRPETKPEPVSSKPAGPMPGWLPFAGIGALALIIFFVQRSGLLG
ncbi:hypothetical protein NIM87_14605 [Devosia sp. XJ19-1]|uniref:Uncharacterized protein n=1 Tax=Devosia ureilytica TaxID=2952754 RepID=A0A9Q4AQ82_9HYPH|nr:hypothetical protein [Devosia ureilytica]MCP8884742.1 hypothetical protein [Devosia ureilytica]MCP8888373.1 hypothetical protein [Devosia ureilytica]